MSLSLVLMVPYPKIDTRAAFPAAFQAAGLPWLRVVVSLGALLAIVTGVLVGVMAVSRILSAVGRAHLVFPFLGRVHHKFGTPAARCIAGRLRGEGRNTRGGGRPAGPLSPWALSHPLPACPPLPSPPRSTIALGVPTLVLALLSDLPMLVGGPRGAKRWDGRVLLPGYPPGAWGLLPRHATLPPPAPGLPTPSGPCVPTPPDQPGVSGDAVRVRHVSGGLGTRPRGAPGGQHPQASRAPRLRSPFQLPPLTCPTHHNPLPPIAPPRVALGLLIKRYTLPPNQSKAVGPPRRMLRTGLIALLLFNSAALGVTYSFDVHFWVYILLVGLQLAFTVALHVFAVQAPRPDYVAPLFPVRTALTGVGARAVSTPPQQDTRLPPAAAQRVPTPRHAPPPPPPKYVPSASLMINAWLCSTLPAESWWHFAIFLAVVTFIYFVYSCAGSLALEEHSLKRRGASVTGRAPILEVPIVRIVSQAPDTGALVYMPQRGADLGDPKALEGAKAADVV
jgi:hypothetical protein